MTWDSVLSLVLSGAGLGASAVAAIKADGAKRAVSKILAKDETQVDRQTALDLSEILSEARDAAKARQQGASQLLQGKRNVAGDIQALQDAQDALATYVFSSDEKLTAKLRPAAKELTRALTAINTGGPRDGWADALGEIQGLIAEVELKQRYFKKQTIL